MASARADKGSAPIRGIPTAEEIDAAQAEAQRLDDDGATPVVEAAGTDVPAEAQPEEAEEAPPVEVKLSDAEAESAAQVQAETEGIDEGSPVDVSISGVEVRFDSPDATAVVSAEDAAVLLSHDAIEVVD